MDGKVYAVDVVVFNQTRSMPPLLLLHAKGRAISGGWTHGRLSPYVYAEPPSDGIWEFDFIATPPSGLATTSISPIESEILTVIAPEWCKGVRVYASSNKLDIVQKNEAFDLARMIRPENWVPMPWSRGADRSLAAAQLADDGGGASTSSAESLVSPWTLSLNDLNEGASDSSLLERPIGDLIGQEVRIYREGDLITFDHRPDRINIVLSRSSNVIVAVKYG